MLRALKVRTTKHSNANRAVHATATAATVVNGVSVVTATARNKPRLNLTRNPTICKAHRRCNRRHPARLQQHRQHRQHQRQLLQRLQLLHQ